ncbi:hypothetical protein CBP51_01240 [Cellvibrio mixtus]|uniref:Uncharacterized protein n=1 Tax=Cellvibrio mixtus TaxID=39650 RepID=A0A266Q745_9GAMM|nr:hypothetical protein [Cellvibrio mixtus]OZY85707.1 hypothetical protein CBP51_01240 [Cellvibrio mixtus]
MEITLNKNEMIGWLKKASAITILSISLAGSLAELRTNITSPIKMASALTQNVEFLGDGPYLIKYEPSSSDEEKELVYSTFAVAFTLQVKLASGSSSHGGYPQLIEALSGYEILSSITNQNGILTGNILILLPESPVELLELEKTLESASIFYAFPDGTGTLNEFNMKQGKGIYLRC